MEILLHHFQLKLLILPFLFRNLFFTKRNETKRRLKILIELSHSSFSDKSFANNDWLKKFQISNVISTRKVKCLTQSKRFFCLRCVFCLSGRKTKGKSDLGLRQNKSSKKTNYYLGNYFLMCFWSGSVYLVAQILI
jgi:RNase P subunit RPR2